MSQLIPVNGIQNPPDLDVAIRKSTQVMLSASAALRINSATRLGRYEHGMRVPLLRRGDFSPAAQ
ncbi:MAG TPA: hypothetical protein VHM64_13190, partial [Candidatus Binatia bacterium]|nr:hypothetical protein [Candidatus Binatia bacterium]